MIEISGYTRAMLGERYNGDNIFFYQDDDLAVISVIDGIGHGKVAHEISNKIRNYLESNITNDPSEMIAKTHDHMRGCEGAALGIGIIINEILTFASLGNISCFVKGNPSKTLVSSEGLLGVRGRTAKKDTKKLIAGDLIVMHSDGVSRKNFMKEVPNHHLYSAKVLAKRIVKELGSPYDDASAVVAQIKE